MRLEVGLYKALVVSFFIDIIFPEEGIKLTEVDAEVRIEEGVE
jgi:hypothetical protein